MLDTLYVVLVILTALVGFGVVFQRVSDTNEGTSRWLEFGSIAVAFVFVIAVSAIQLL